MVGPVDAAVPAEGGEAVVVAVDTDDDREQNEMQPDDLFAKYGVSTWDAYYASIREAQEVER
eukprot:9251078-Alexandrium_andersonii.AAC.1